jgi:hypothetical protein
VGPWGPHALSPLWVTGGGGLDPPGALIHILRAGQLLCEAAGAAKAAGAVKTAPSSPAVAPR